MSQAAAQPRLILASQSPRRRYLLQQAGLRFEVIPSTCDESAFIRGEPQAFVKDLAEAKAHDVAGRCPEAWVIGADTIVAVDGRFLGKPQTSAEARAMLRRLSGKVHQVFTGYCVCRRSRHISFVDAVKTDVYFKELTEAEIEWYIHTREPFDKAGAYAIQGIGTFLVKRINGSYTNVVGLPVCELIEFLLREGVIGFEAG